jgi:hypothetical protein
MVWNLIVDYHILHQNRSIYLALKHEHLIFNRLKSASIGLLIRYYVNQLINLYFAR